MFNKKTFFHLNYSYDQLASITLIDILNIGTPLLLVYLNGQLSINTFLFRWATTHETVRFQKVIR